MISKRTMKDRITSVLNQLHLRDRTQSVLFTSSCLAILDQMN
ncbi:hypothetical protein [Chroococcidiopsis sp [FACHB-1243]]|nr:hypothetical protein [Chroococcidiopsis sp. [FACHB-1243]]